MQNREIYNIVANKAKAIFQRPAETYSYESIVVGCPVKSELGEAATMYAVAKNTWRGFHRIDKSKDGAGSVFMDYFIKKKQYVIDALKTINTVEELDLFEDQICQEIKEELVNIKQDMKKSYNKIRKPVDLYIEHIVSMAKELEGHRDRLAKLLFLPLDSQILASEYIFDTFELSRCGLKRSSTYGDIESKKVYKYIQELLITKAKEINEKEFCRIYFDLFWNDRYLKKGTNLFQTNF